MLNKIKFILVVIGMAVVFTAQISRGADQRNPQQDQQRVGQRAIARHNSPSREPAPRTSGGSHPTPVQNRQQSPRQGTFSRVPVEKHVWTQPAQHEKQEGSRVYAVTPVTSQENNNLFHRHHHKGWRPRYNFYDNEYHFYPYVNITASVELSSDYVSLVFNGQNYYYDQGTFYFQDVGGQYVAVAPPVGIIVNPIAPQARQIIINGQVFYRYKGVFYVQVAEGYQVIEPLESTSEDTSS